MIEYEGKAKQIIPTAEADVVIQRFKDSATAFNGQKKAELEGKGEINAAMSAAAFSKLESAGISTHFIGLENPRDMRIKRLKIVPLEVVVRNVVAGSLSKRLGLDEGVTLKFPIVETYFKRDDLGDPMVCDSHVFVLGICSEETLGELKSRALRVNSVLGPWFEAVGLRLVDFKLEFGFDESGKLYLGDEISPDTCRIWDRASGRRLDKDVFRRDLGDPMVGYREVLDRLGITPGGEYA